MKIGSLFDGSGGFPLAGMINGFTPTWASEVEPYPIAVTRARIPGMKHLGSVTEINGAEIDPVDVITFGSPCQDLSVAGKQKGIHEGERSSLFFEAIRIIKEMRAHDRAAGRTGEHVRPRFAVWENVPGAYSSNGGHDFQAVLQALCEIADPAVSIPFPQKGKWANAGCIVGDGYSIAWRTYDAQYWHGTPQRRKRIYLIADFASERAGEILFEQESMPRDIEPGEKEGQGTAENTDGSLAGSDCRSVILDDQGGGQITVRNDDKSPTDAVCYAPNGNHCGVYEKTETAATLQTRYHYGSGGDAAIAVYDTTQITSPANYSNPKQPIFNEAYQHHGWRETDISGTLTAGQNDKVRGDTPLVVAQVPHTLKIRSGCDGDGRNSINYQNPVVYNCLNPWDNQSARQYTVDGVYETLKAHQGGRCEGVIYPSITGALCANSHPGSYTGQDAYNDMLPVIKSDKPPRKWIVRRLTPLECCRLQGFPDGWGDTLEITDLTDDDYAFWLSVRNTHAAINEKKQGNYTKEQMIRWLNALHTDSAEYKMWGNGIALPCARDVMRRIAKAIGGVRDEN